LDLLGGHLREEPAAALWRGRLSLCEDRSLLLWDAHCGALGGRWCDLPGLRQSPAEPRRLLLAAGYKARINLSPGLVVLKENVMGLSVVTGPDRLA
jgi:hypothetical protein